MGQLQAGPQSEGILSFPASPQTLKMELSRVQEAKHRRQQQTASAEEQLKLVAKAISRCLEWRGEGGAAVPPQLLGHPAVRAPPAGGAWKEQLENMGLVELSCPWRSCWVCLFPGGSYLDSHTR